MGQKLKNYTSASDVQWDPWMVFSPNREVVHTAMRKILLWDKLTGYVLNNTKIFRLKKNNIILKLKTENSAGFLYIKWTHMLQFLASAHGGLKEVQWDTILI